MHNHPSAKDASLPNTQDESNINVKADIIRKTIVIDNKNSSDNEYHVFPLHNFHAGNTAMAKYIIDTIAYIMQALIGSERKKNINTQ